MGTKIEEDRVRAMRPPNPISGVARCMAEYATKAIVAGILQADKENSAMH